MAINWTNVTTWEGMLSGANTNSGSWFWTFLLYGLWAIFLIMFSTFGFEVTLLISSFLALVVGLLFVYAGLINITWVLTFVGLILIMFLYITWSKRS